MSCIAYLCQHHHDPDLIREEIVRNVLAGTYIFQTFAATTWLGLVERSLGLYPNDEVPDDLICLLEELSSERTNFAYEGEPQDVKTSMIQKMKERWPELYDMLFKAAHFRHVSSTSQDRIGLGTYGHGVIDW